VGIDGDFAGGVYRLAGRAVHGTVGLPLSSTAVVARDDSGHELPLGQTGELCVQGPQVMLGIGSGRMRRSRCCRLMGGCEQGYWTRESHGLVYIEDRKKDLILVSGFNVYPNEVEAVVITLPGLLEAAAVAQPDPHSGEVVALFVVSQDQSITKQKVIDHCRRSLASYKVPRHVYFHAELPKTNVGKICVGAAGGSESSRSGHNAIGPRSLSVSGERRWSVESESTR